MISLGESLPKEIERVMELIKEYENVRMGYIAASMMRHDIEEAHTAMISGDLVGMIQSHQKLKEYE